MLRSNFSNIDYSFLIVYAICEKYKLAIPKYLSAEMAYLGDNEYKRIIMEVILKIFGEINAYPVKLLAYSKKTGSKGELVTSPHDFLLDNGKTLSIKTSISNGEYYKAAPRVVGQAGYNVLNKYFETLYGKKIETQDDIKRLFISKIDDILPIFIEKMFDSDYTLFIQRENEKNCLIVNKDNIELPIFEKADFTFTRNMEDWSESTSLKYKNITIAEIQTRKSRTFKFRFIINNLLKYIYKY